mgnify:CR=1 FL=1
MKTFWAIVDSIFHKESKHEAWNQIKYLVVLGHIKIALPHTLGEDYAYKTSEFVSKQEALDYLDQYISKADKKVCHLYKEIKL